MNKDIRIGKYKDINGNIYEVLNIARRTNSDANYVVYKTTMSDQVWLAPEDKWIEFANKPIMSNHVIHRRLEFVGE